MHSVEYLGKCRRLIYLKETGEVQGKHSGGGAMDQFTGDALLVMMFNDKNAPEKFGCIEAYFNPIGNPRPGFVNLSNVSELQSKSQAFVEHRKVCPHPHTHYGDCPDCTSTFDALCDTRDACIEDYIYPVDDEE